MCRSSEIRDQGRSGAAQRFPQHGVNARSWRHVERQYREVRTLGRAVGTGGRIQAAQFIGNRRLAVVWRPGKHIHPSSRCLRRHHRSIFCQKYPLSLLISCTALSQQLCQLTSGVHIVLLVEDRNARVNRGRELPGGFHVALG